MSPYTTKILLKASTELRIFFQVKKAQTPHFPTLQIPDLPLILLNLTSVWQTSSNSTQYQARTSDERKRKNQIMVFLSYTN